MTTPNPNTDPIAAVLMQVPMATPAALRALSASQWQQYLAHAWAGGPVDEIIWIESELELPTTALPRDAEVVALRRPDNGQLYVLSKNRTVIYRFIEYLRALTEEYEPAVTRALRSIVKSGWVCVDVGSHIGRISLLLAELVGPSGKVHSFDAFAPNVEDLRRLSALKGLNERISVTHAAVSDGTASTLLLYSGRGDSSAEWNLRGLDVEGNTTAAKFEVPAVALDAVLGDGRVDLVKIDVEGAAAGVLRGMRGIFERNTPAFLIEFHSAEEREAVQFLYDAGYTMTDLSSGAPAIPGQEGYQCLALPPRMHRDGAPVIQ